MVLILHPISHKFAFSLFSSDLFFMRLALFPSFFTIQLSEAVLIIYYLNLTTL